MPGLHALYLFFDDPEDHAIPVARRVAASLRSCTVCIHECSELWWAQQKTRSRFYRYRHLKWAGPVVETHEGLRDVQCRQQLCVDLAVQDAFRDGVDWLVHIDIDELLYFPHEKYREDASGWFGRVDPDVDLIKFHNHECVPEEMEVGDWFRDITLFKPAITFLVQPDDPHQLPEVTPPQSGDDKADSGSDKTDDEEEPQEKLKINEVDNVLTTIAFARTRHMKTLGLNLPEQPWLRRRRLRLERRQKRREARGLKCDPAERNRLPETFTHFIAYANGKCAVRIQSAGTRAMVALCQTGPAQGAEVDVRVIDSLPLPNGVHSFMTGIINNDRGRIRQLRRQRRDGLEDPVVLHYANSGFSYWVRKYEMLGKFPDVVNGKQNTMRAHLAARDVICGSRSLEQLELFYRLFVMCNVIGELPLLFNRGLVIRIDGARQIVERSSRAASA